MKSQQNPDNYPDFIKTYPLLNFFQLLFYPTCLGIFNLLVLFFFTGLAQTATAQDTLKTIKGNITEMVVSYPNGSPREIIRMKEGKKHGSQESFFPDGKPSKKITYQNDWLHGPYLLYDNQGHLKEKKNYKYHSEQKKSILHGAFEQYNNNVLWIKTSYKDGLKHGKYEGYHSNGKIKTIARYKMDLLHGEKKEFNNQDRLASQTKHKIIEEGGKRKSVLHGKSFQYDNSGNISKEGNFKRGQKQGLHKEYYSGKLNTETNFKNDKRHGLHANYYPDGNLKSRWKFYDELEVGGKLLKNVFDGRKEEYFKNGKVQNIEHYDLGQKTGTWERYYENGTLKESVEYINNHYGGKTTYWDEKGNKKSEANYVPIKSGTVEGSVKHGMESHWENNVLVFETEYINGLEQGTRKTWHKSGKPASEAEFKDGQMHGKSTNYYENGNIKSVRTYYFDTLASGQYQTRTIGWRYEYNEDGNFKNKYFADSSGTILVALHYHRGVLMQKDFKDIMQVNYFPNGKVMAIQHGDGHGRHGKSFYLNGKLRKLSIQN
nr:toxin-antitoxin system YwqK family antitoxin [Bacteroidota bacterium]